MSISKNKITILTNLQVQPAITGPQATPRASNLYQGLGIPAFPDAASLPLPANSKVGSIAYATTEDNFYGFYLDQTWKALNHAFLGQRASDPSSLTPADFGSWYYNTDTNMVEFYTANGFVTMDSGVACYGGLVLTSPGIMNMTGGTPAPVSPGDGSALIATPLSNLTVSGMPLGVTVPLGGDYKVSIDASLNSTDNPGITASLLLVVNDEAPVTGLTPQSLLGPIDGMTNISSSTIITIAPGDSFVPYIITSSDCTLQFLNFNLNFKNVSQIAAS